MSPKNHYYLFNLASTGSTKVQTVSYLVANWACHIPPFTFPLSVGKQSSKRSLLVTQQQKLTDTTRVLDSGVVLPRFSYVKRQENNGLDLTRVRKQAVEVSSHPGSNSSVVMTYCFEFDPSLRELFGLQCAVY
jgi:hypothetical protein